MVVNERWHKQKTFFTVVVTELKIENKQVLYFVYTYVYIVFINKCLILK